MRRYAAVTRTLMDARGARQAMSRLVPALVLVSALLAFVPHPAALFAVWVASAAALVVALRSPDTRAPASYALAALVVIVVGTLAGAGATLRGTALAAEALEIFILAVIATIWIPGGVFLATGEGGAPRRLARVGLGFVAAWLAVFGVVLAVEARSDAHIIVLVPGAVLIVVALVWRAVRPVTPRATDAAPTP